mmetsp:Transcript_129574/g.414438  ORF Transcript_129574/g.414438 Transcript_129574/m.414438 type:complete len:262 (+) Transcript_129574:1025-1810(+)
MPRVGGERLQAKLQQAVPRKRLRCGSVGLLQGQRGGLFHEYAHQGLDVQLLVDHANRRQDVDHAIVHPKQPLTQAVRVEHGQLRVELLAAGVVSPRIGVVLVLRLGLHPQDEAEGGVGRQPRHLKGTAVGGAGGRRRPRREQGPASETLAASNLNDTPIGARLHLLHPMPQGVANRRGISWREVRQEQRVATRPARQPMQGRDVQRLERCRRGSRDATHGDAATNALREGILIKSALLLGRRRDADLSLFLPWVSLVSLVS